MKIRITKKLGYDKLGFMLVVLASLIFNGCSKEEFGILDVPFEELESSYYVLADETIEIPYESLDELVISRTDFTMTLNDDDLFESLEVGSILASDFSTPRDEVVHREVIGIERTGDQIEITSQPTTLLKTYSRYRIDSSLPNIIRARNDVFNIEPLFSAGSDILNQSFAAFKGAGLIPFDVNLDVGLSGNLSYIAEHPHDWYVRLNQCEAGTDCELDNDEEDSDGNGVFDIVENALLVNFNDSLYINGFFTISINELKFKSLTLGKSTQNEDKPLSDIYDEIKDLSKEISSEVPKEVNYTYAPIPFLNFGLIGANAVSGPIFDIVANLSFTAKAELKNGGSVDIVLANVIEQKDVMPAVRPRFSITSEGGVSNLFANSNTDLDFVLSGSIDARLGFSIGAALTVGEARTAGVSFGAAVELGLWSKFSGEGGIRFVDIFNQGISANNFDFHGKLCADFGLFYDLVLFTDANLIISSIPDQLDVKLRIPKESLGLNNPSWFTTLPFPSSFPLIDPTDGLCLQTMTECDNIKKKILEVGSIFNINSPSSIIARFNLEFPDFSFGKYSINLKHKTGEVLLSNPNITYEYNSTHTFNFIDTDLNVNQAIVDGDLEVIITDEVVGCSKTFRQSEIALILNCGDDGISYEDNSANLDSTITNNNIIGEPITQFTSAKAKIQCNQKLITQSTLENLLNDECVNPTGYLIPDKDMNVTQVFTDRLFVWIEGDAPHTLLEVQFAVVDGLRKVVKTSIITAPSPSVRAPCLCES